MELAEYLNAEVVVVAVARPPERATMVKVHVILDDARESLERAADMPKKRPEWKSRLNSSSTSQKQMTRLPDGRAQILGIDMNCQIGSGCQLR